MVLSCSYKWCWCWCWLSPKLEGAGADVIVFGGFIGRDKDIFSLLQDVASVGAEPGGVTRLVGPGAVGDTSQWPIHGHTLQAVGCVVVVVVVGFGK